MADMIADSKALSVSAALAMAKGALEGISVTIVGEISELSMNPRYKAVYFTVKDESASLPCMMWTNRYASSGVELRIGALIEIKGRFSLYAAKGRMNFDVSAIQLAGEGRLRMQVAALARRLQAEGLMEPSRKAPLPYAPERIGVVTSPRGAAVYDVLRTLRRRFPLASVFVAGVTVEGRDAPRQIVHGLDLMDGSSVDVVLLVRGGGSFEDLMPFNDEEVVRRIAAMQVPVITGIGHEPDTSIADMVSDRRASTPTAAAEAAVPALPELKAGLSSIQSRMEHSIGSLLDENRHALDRISSSPALSDPMRPLSQSALRLDELARRIAAGLSVLPDAWATKLSVAKSRIMSSSRTFASRHEADIKAHAASLEALSPLSVLSRGYSITRDSKGRIVNSAGSLSVGEAAQVQLSEGGFECTVTSLQDFEMSLEEMDG